MNPCAHRSSVEQHFAGRIRPDQERALRDHLPGCAACGEIYRRHLLLEALDPDRPDPVPRLGRGLGLAMSARPAAPEPAGTRRSGWSLRVLMPAASLALLLVILSLGPRPPRPATDPEMQARGTPRVELQAYRLRPGTSASLVIDRLGAGDELAFAYRNPRGWRYLMVFAVDEHGHVYWYHPGWADARSTPGAVAIETGTRSIELPEGIAHVLDGERLLLHALFLDRTMTVREIESLLATPSGRQQLEKLGQHRTRQLRVERKEDR